MKSKQLNGRSLQMQSRRMWDILWALGSIAILLFLIWRAKYGYCSTDEGGYLAIPYRLVLGDALFRHEWHLSQTASVLLYPLLNIYLFFTQGGTEGIYLHFRYIMIAYRMLASIFVYCRLKRMTPSASAIALSYLLILYTPDINYGFSYNSNAMLLLALSIVTIVTTEENAKLDWCFAGAFFACAVLTSPYFVVAWGLFAIASFTCDIYRRTTQRPLARLRQFSLRNAFFFTLGCAVVALPFLIFVLSRASIPEIVAVIPIILDDPDHPPITFMRKVREFIGAFIGVPSLPGKILFFLFLLVFALCLWQRVHHKHSNVRRQKYLYIYVCAIFSILAFPLFDHSINVALFPFCMCGAIFYLLTEHKRITVFLFLYCGGLLLGALRHLGSNTIAGAMCAGTVLSVIASGVFAAQLIQEDTVPASGVWRRITHGVLAAMVILNLVVCVAFSVTSVVMDAPISELQVTIPNGPQAGIRTTQARRARYEGIWAETEPIRKDGTGPVLFFSEDSWLWLSIRSKYGTSSTWMNTYPPDRSIRYIEKLKKYYKQFPDRWPRYCYITKESMTLKATFDPEVFITEFGLTNAAISRLTYGYLVYTGNVV